MTRSMDHLLLLTHPSFGGDPGATPATATQVLEEARFLKTKWRDTVKAQLSDGWKKLQAMAPSQAKAVQMIADTANEQSEATLLLVYNKAFAASTAAFKDLEKSVGAQERAEGLLALGEMKKALSNAQGGVDPNSAQAFAFIESVLTGTPVSTGISTLQRLAASRIRAGLSLSGKLEPLLKDVTGLFYNLHGVAKAAVTVLAAAGVGAIGVAQGMTIKDGTITLNFPPDFALSSIAPWLPKLGIKSVALSGGELSQLSTRLIQTLGQTGLSVTAAADYKKSDPLFASGGIAYTRELPGGGRLAASGTVSSRFAPNDLTYAARVEAAKTLGKKQNLDVSAYAQVSQTPGMRTETQAGAKLTQRFGDAELVERAKHAVARREFIERGRKTHRANPVLVRKLAGPLPWLSRMFQRHPGPRGERVPEPYIDLPPDRSTLPWAWIGWGAGIVGVLGIGWVAAVKLGEPA